MRYYASDVVREDGTIRAPHDRDGFQQRVDENLGRGWRKFLNSRN